MDLDETAAATAAAKGRPTRFSKQRLVLRTAQHDDGFVDGDDKQVRCREGPHLLVVAQLRDR